ncbi:MAG: GTPase HflX [Candidatus Omnitrophota bacterium]
MAEKVLVVTIDFGKRNEWPSVDIADELKELVLSCGGDVINSVIHKCSKPTAAFLIHEGKVREIADLCAQHEIDTVIFSHDLKGSQQRNIEKILGVKTIDRTQLILDIFARRAKSQEGRMQVELAQLEYLRPRLVGHGIELSRLGGGIGTLGPGETKLEVDRRRIDSRIDRLRKDLKEIVQSRATKRKKRKQEQIPTVTLVGYTNAGKSTLLNTLTESQQITHDGLFTTLDPLTRQLMMPNHQKLVLSDTVGFMYELPHHLIESFKATLEEVMDADLLLHVLDISNPKFRNLQEAVMKVLHELGAQDKPIVTVLNKIDRLDDLSWLDGIMRNFDHAVYISALKGERIDILLEKINQILVPTTTQIDVRIPLNRMDLVHLVHNEGDVKTIEYLADAVHVIAVVPFKIANKVEARNK